MTDPTYTAPAGLSVGHVHLRVSDLSRAVAFYRDVIGLEVQARYGEAAFMSAGGYHHHLGLNTWSSLGGDPAPRNTAGLYHAAFLYPSRADLARAVKQVVDAGVTITGASDHGVSEAVYFDDPDGNGIELYRDRPHEEWPRDADGALAMQRTRLDVQALLAEAGGSAA